MSNCVIINIIRSTPEAVPSSQRERERRERERERGGGGERGGRERERDGMVGQPGLTECTWLSERGRKSRTLNYLISCWCATSSQQLMSPQGEGHTVRGCGAGLFACMSVVYVWMCLRVHVRWCACVMKERERGGGERGREVRERGGERWERERERGEREREREIVCWLVA